MAISVPKLTQIFVPIKKKPNPKGSAYTNTFQPNNTASVLQAPDYRNHLRDIFTDRQSQDSKNILKDLIKYDSDVSATLHAFLTTANTEPRFYVYDAEGVLDRDGQKDFEVLKTSLVRRNDYSTGFSFTASMRDLAEACRYMVLLRGAVAAELVFNKFLLPSEIRHIDMGTVEWFEKTPGVYKPQQKPPGAPQPITLDVANIFIKYYRQNPTEIYPESMFVSSINTIAARQQVINDLYRIMQVTGYPRLEATIVEEVLRKNAPSEMQADEGKMGRWLASRLQEVANDLTNLRADAAYVHFDAVEAKILNDKGPGSSMDVTSIIEVLNAQNQAALKTMGTIIGRGEGGVNTASVEARIFSMAAESLNGPIADLFSDMFTFAMRLLGYEGFVVCKFDPVELRPSTELEPQLIMRQQRLLNDLSWGLITDDEYHIAMYNRLRPDSSPELSGTEFMTPAPAAGSDASKVSPNSDPLGRSITPSGSKSARSNTVKKPK